MENTVFTVTCDRCARELDGDWDSRYKIHADHSGMATLATPPGFALDLCEKCWSDVRDALDTLLRTDAGRIRVVGPCAG